MPENNFEKQVQQKMDELKIVPSETVWQKVQAQIPSEKKKRRFIWLPLIFLLGILITSYLLIDLRKTFFINQDNQIQGNQRSVDKKTIVKQTIKTLNEKSAVIPVTKSKKDFVVKDKVYGENNNENKSQGVIQKELKRKEASFINKKNTDGNIRALSKQANQTDAVGSKTIIEKNDGNKFGDKKQDGVSGDNLSAVNKKSIFNKRKFTIEAREKITITNATTDGEIITPENNNDSDRQEIAKASTAKGEPCLNNSVVADSNKQRGIVKLKVPTVVNEDKKTEIKTVAKTKENNKWNYSVAFSGGLSATANTFLGRQANKNFSSYLSSDLTNTTTGSIGNGIYTNNNYPPPAIRQGIGLNIGLTAARIVSKRSNLSVGINYKYLSTSISVGIDSLVNFSLGNTNSYHNQYHFIEIPVSFQSRIGKEKLHSLYGNTGIVFSQLLSATALQLNNQNGSYYSRNKMFNKITLGLSAGFSINLSKNKNAPLLLGPEFYYSLTPVATTGLYTHTHYSFVGLRLQKYLKRK